MRNKEARRPLPKGQERGGHNSGQGFTLIELLVVIAIIALLVSILLPSLQSAKDLAKEIICQANLRGIHTAISLYSEDTEGYLPQPYYSFMPSNTPNLINEQWSSWRHLLTQYPENYMVNTYGTGVWRAPISYVDDYELYVCPMDDRAPDQSIARRGSYGINGQMGYSMGKHVSSNVPYFLHGTLRPDQMYLITESWHWYTSYVVYSTASSYGFSNPPPYADGDIYYYSTRHGGDGERGYVLFHDGHIEYETYQTIGVCNAPGHPWPDALPWRNGLKSVTWRGIPPTLP